MTQPINIPVKRPKAITARQLQRLNYARQLLMKRQQEILWGNPAAASTLFPQAEIKTCKELVEDYLKITTSGLVKSTVDDKTRNLKVFTDWLGPRPFNREAVEQFNLELHKIDWSEGSKWYCGRTLASFLNWLYDTKRIAEDWRRGVKFPKQPTQKPRENYTREEIDSLLEAAGDRPIGFIIRLGYHTGMALTDCANLVWGQVDMDKGIIRRPRQKTGVESIVTFDFGTPMRAALERQREDTIRAFGKVEPGLPVCRWAISNKHSMAVMFKRLCKTANVKYRSFHSLRATMISELAHSDAPLAVCMNMVGLKKPEQFLAYSTPQPEKIRSQLNKLRP